MKRKLHILNALMGLVVLFAILIQSIDAIGHLEQQFSTKHCHHSYNHSQTEVGHAHEGFDHCFVCEFAFSSFISTPTTVFTSPKVDLITKYSFCYSREITQFFRGSLFALRAPPGFIA
jgi:hypothetical protein